MLTRREVTSNITNSVVRYYTKKRFCVNAEIGLRSRREGMLRADVLALNMKHEIIIIECKSSLADFKADNKYEQYLEYCNKLYIACNPETYKKIKNLVNTNVGLIVVSETRPRVVKPARRRILDPDTRLSIITRLAFRNAEFNRYKKKRR